MDEEVISEYEVSEVKEEPLLEVKNLKVQFEILGGRVHAVDGISFTLNKGETMGLVGESGCGKTTAAFAISRLLPSNGFVVDGEVIFDGKVIASKEEYEIKSPRKRRKRAKELEKEMDKIRWTKISMIFQSAMNALNPVYKVGDQIAEAISTHEDISKAEVKQKVLKLFDLVGIDKSRVEGYPHEFSGGMKQRSVIAMALACNPALVIADEPTTALDVIMQDRILAVIRDLQRKLGVAMVIITHDISVVAEVSEKIGIMYAGKLLEWGNIVSIFKRPANPYTIGLLGAFPSVKGEKRRLMSIPGSPPDLVNPPSGCRFHPRCKFVKDICKEVEPEIIEVAPNHFSACHFAQEIFDEHQGTEGNLEGGTGNE